MTELNAPVEKEFNRQIDQLLTLKYHQIAKVTEKQFREITAPLLVSLKNEPTVSYQNIPFVLVTKQELVSSELAMEKIVIKN